MGGELKPKHLSLQRPLSNGLLLAFFLLSGGVLMGAPPKTPLPLPYYSFDLASPAVIHNFVDADDVLALNLPYPIPVVHAVELGLGATGDDLDALSGGNNLFPPQA